MALFTPRTRPVNRSEAWGCLVMNALICPGMGTLVAGRKIGFAQIAGAGVGLLIALMAFFKLLADLSLIATGEKVPKQAFVIGLIGVGVFAIFWIWGLITGFSILRSTPP